MVMGGDSCPRGCEFKSQRRILDGSFFTFFCCKIVLLGEKTGKEPEWVLRDGLFNK